MCLCFPPGDEIGWIHFFVCLAPLRHACPCCFVTRKGSTTVTEWRKMVGSSKWAQRLQSKPFPGASATQGWFEIFQGLLPPRPKCIYFTNSIYVCVVYTCVCSTCFVHMTKECTPTCQSEVDIRMSPSVFLHLHPNLVWRLELVFLASLASQKFPWTLSISSPRAGIRGSCTAVSNVFAGCWGPELRSHV